ncbi:MAG: hypothetical protein AAB501_03865 [Patescibacteria group bacterium]
MKDMEKKMLAILNDSDHAVNLITNARLPGQALDYDVPFEVISRVGLETLRKHSARLAINVEHSDYGNYFLEEECD